MKAIIRKTLLFSAIVVLTISFATGQRVIKGIVYLEGKPAAGITVEAHKGGQMMTSFDGKYKIEADEIRKDLTEQKTLLVNLMSSPGSGKTSLITRTIESLKNEIKNSDLYKILD